MDLSVSRSRRRISPYNTILATLVAPLKSGLITTMNLMKILAALLVSLPVLVTLSLVLRSPPPDRIKGFADARVIQRLTRNDTSSSNSGNHIQILNILQLFDLFFLRLAAEKKKCKRRNNKISYVEFFIFCFLHAIFIIWFCCGKWVTIKIPSF